MQDKKFSEELKSVQLLSLIHTFERGRRGQNNSPGGPVVKSLSSQGRGCGFDPCLGN